MNSSFFVQFVLLLAFLFPHLLFSQANQWPINAGDSSGANILFTDIAPDILLNTNDTVWLDVDQDSNPDLYAVYTVSSGPNSAFREMEVSPVGVTEIFAYEDTSIFQGQGFYFAYPFPFGFQLIGNAPWRNAPCHLVRLTSNPNSTIENPHWVGLEERYLGFRIPTATDIHYGWLKLRVEPGSSMFDRSLILEASAISRTPATSLADELSLSAVSCGPNPLVDQLYVKRGLDQGRSIHFSLYDLNGVQVREWQLAPHRQNEMVNLDGLAPGIYFLKGESDKASRIWKLVKAAGN